MTDDKNIDIVEEVFGRPMKVNDRASALLACPKLPEQVSPEEGQEGTLDLKGSPAAKDKDSNRRVWTVVVAGFAVLVLAFFVGGYLVRQGTASTKTMPQEQYVNRSEIVSMAEKQPVLDVQPEPVPAEIDKNLKTVDWQQVIDWSSLLGEISATIPKAAQLSVIESGDGSELFLEGEALTTDAVYNFVDALSANRQVKSAELTKTGIGTGKLQDRITFSISCFLVSDTKMPGTVDGDYNNSRLDRSRLLTPKEAEEFLDSIQPVLEHTGCTVKSLLVSPKDAVFKDEKTNGRIIKKHVALTLQGGYQDILKAVEELQNHLQGAWFDSVSIKQGSETGRLECSMGISIYVAEGDG